MTDAPERIWAFHDGPMVGLFVGKNNFGEGSNVAEYVRADLTPQWQPIDTAPDLERVLICGWQPKSGRVAGYWWWEEGHCENGQALDRPDATLWAPIQLPVFPKPPEAT